MKRAIIALILATTSAGPAAADDVFEQAFAGVHRYLIGAMICHDYVGDADLDAAHDLVKRFWVSEGMTGGKLDAAMSLSDTKVQENIGGRSLPSEMPGFLTNADQAVACRQTLDAWEADAESAVIAKEAG